VRTLVLGGSRFVGLHLVYELLRQGHEVTTFSRGRTVVDLPADVRRLYGDRHNLESIHSALGTTSFDAVFDTSGYTVDEVRPMMEVFRGRVALYGFCSTTWVYARSDLAPVSEDFPVERGPGATDYVANKIRCEDMLLEAHDRDGFPASIIRPSMIMGRDNRIYEREASFFTRLLLGRKILMPSNGSALLHFSHVDDVAQASVSLLGNERALGQAYTISLSHAITIKGYLETLGRVVGAEPNIVPISFELMEELDRPVFPFPYEWSTVYSIRKAAEQLGYTPRYDMESGLVGAYEWYKERDILHAVPFDFRYEDEVLAMIGA